MAPSTATANAPSDAVRGERREQLIAATIEVIARHGLSATTVARVAEAALELLRPT